MECGLDIGECAVDCGWECISCIGESIEQCIGCLTAVDVIKNIGTHLTIYDKIIIPQPIHCKMLMFDVF